MTHLSLFSGIGGLNLAAEMAGFETVGQCEWADYQTKVLEKHWPDVPRWRDIRTLTGESFYERTGLRTVDVISGGFQCQPFSQVGKQRGKDDDRYLWPEMLRIIRELKPTWVLGENVPGIINLALDTVLSDLEAEGYETQTFVVPACGVDAPHRRNRVAILAHSESTRSWRLPIFQGEPQQKVIDADRDSETVSNTSRWWEQRKLADWCEAWGSGGGGWWAAEPRVGRVAHGIPHRMDRIKCLGNAVVPQQFYPFFMAIMEAEKGESNGNVCDTD